MRKLLRWMQLKITKQELQQIIQEEINEMLGGGNYPGSRGPSTAHMTIGEIEEVVAAAGVQGLMYGHAKELMEALDRANINRREFEQMLRNLPHHAKTTGRPYSALSWIHQQIG